ncbi:Clavesin-1 [Varanus komodoensis]|nr:Clavesin-1 [Varanus komodoensis]
MTHLHAGLSPETIEKARLELNENPDVLHQNIQQVRDMIITRPDIGFLRTDDAFILRFLRARKFHQTDAFRLLAQYFQYRQLNLDMFKNFKADDPGIKRALIDGFPGVLENRDHYGRKILLLFAANWDQSSQPCPNPPDSALVYPKTPQFLHQDIMGHFVKGLAEIQYGLQLAKAGPLEVPASSAPPAASPQSPDLKAKDGVITRIQSSPNLYFIYQLLPIGQDQKSIGKKTSAVVEEPEAFLLAPHPKPVVHLGGPPVPSWPQSPDRTTQPMMAQGRGRVDMTDWNEEFGVPVFLFHAWHWHGKAMNKGLPITTMISLSLLFSPRNSFIDILRAILLSLEVLIEDQELQINGFILIIDWSNFSFKQASKLTPSILKLAIEGLQTKALAVSSFSLHHSQHTPKSAPNSWDTPRANCTETTGAEVQREGKSFCVAEVYSDNIT